MKSFKTISTYFIMIIAVIFGCYNPQNETCDALKTKCARNKTKRFIPTKQNVPLNLCFYHSNIVFEWAAYIVRRPFL